MGEFMGKAVGGLFLSLFFFTLGIALASYIPVHAEERLAASSQNFESVSRIPFENIKVYPEQVIIDAPLRYAKVESNSMAPFITDKSTVFEQKPTSPEQILVGDIISFTTAGEKGVIMHAVVEIVQKDGAYYYHTKGFANSEQDPWLVSYDDIVGVVVGTLR